MPSASHSAWLARTRATTSATRSGESTATLPIVSPVAGFITSIRSAPAPLEAAPFTASLTFGAVPLSTLTAPFEKFGWPAKSSFYRATSRYTGPSSEQT